MGKKQDYFKTFCTVSQAFGTTGDKETLLDLIVESAIETMDGKAACLFLADKTDDVFRHVAQKGLSEKYLHANVIKAKRLVTGIGKAGYMSFPDATTDPRLEHHDVKKAEKIASILTVPVTVNENIIGVLSLYTAERRDFSKDEIGFLRALADQGGIAIEHMRMVSRLRDNALLFRDLAANINASLDIKHILSNLTEKVCKALEMKGAAIRLIDQDSNELKLVASWGLSDAFLEKGPVSSTKSAVEALNGNTLVIKDATSDDRIQYKEEMKSEGIGSMIVAPIRSREAVIGVLRLYADEIRHFPEETITLVQALAHQGALAIENASMYLKLQQDKESLEKDIWSHRSWF